MQKWLTIAFLSCWLCFVFVHCDQDITSGSDQPAVQYTVIITDSLSGAIVGSAKIRITQINGDTSTYYTSPLDGQAVLPNINSSRTLFVISAIGYTTKNFIDTVTGTANDTTFHLPIPKILLVKLVNHNTVIADTNQKVQYRIALTGESLQALKSGSISYVDSLHIPHRAIDENHDGVIVLTDLGFGKFNVLVEHAGYLGQKLDIAIEKRLGDSSGSKYVSSFPIRLRPLSNQVSGQVFRKVQGQGNLRLGGARIVFVLKNDSLSYPQTFETRTYIQGDSLGKFLLDSVPEMAGTLKYYLDAAAKEPSLIQELTQVDIALATPLKPVVLEAGAISDAPILVQGPPDTVSSKDTLVFIFNQAVDTLKLYDVQLVNGDLPTLILPNQSVDKKTLRLVQKNAGWNEGKLYRYVLALKTATGADFTVPGSGGNTVTGTFFVRSSTSQDSAFSFLKKIHLAYFNSGIDARFDSLNIKSSLLADSSTNMAMLKWKKQDSTKTSIDSLVIYVKDNQTRTTWQRWSTHAVRGDSLTLAFSEIYSTAAFSGSTNPTFPPKISDHDTLWMQIIPKQKDRVYFDSAFTLPPIVRGMGPSLYVKYSQTDSLWAGPGLRSDTVVATFLVNPNDTNSTTFTIDTATVKPQILSNSTDLTFKWEWTTAHSGRMIYTLKQAVFLTDKWFSVDITNQLSQGKPLWLRNRDTSVYFFR